MNAIVKEERETKVYFISGLGADKRVFENLQIENPLQYHIEWEIPIKNESLKNYCKRLIAQIDTSCAIVLIGVSFGGIIAQEIAKLISLKKIIILSSIKSEDELDWKLRVIGKLNLHKLFPARLLLFLNTLTADYYFGIKSKEESFLLKKIIADTNLVFMVWAIDCCVKWKNNNEIVLLHIHGSQDKVFPVSSIKNYVAIETTGHFMVFSKAKEVSNLINEYIR